MAMDTKVLRLTEFEAPHCLLESLIWFLLWLVVWAVANWNAFMFLCSIDPYAEDSLMVADVRTKKIKAKLEPEERAGSQKLRRQGQ